MNVSADAIAETLYRAMVDKRPIQPPSATTPEMTLDDAYAVSERFLRRRLDDGEKLVGRKIGLTSNAVQSQLGVDEPDFGSLTDAMAYANGDEVPVRQRLMQPKVECEVAFVLGKDLAGPHATEADVLAATHYVVPCFEIVDSRVVDWNIGLLDTVCDNASCGLFLLGDDRADPRDVEFSTCEVVVTTGGAVVAEATDVTGLGSPLTCVAWLANKMAKYGVALAAGDVLLSGSLVPFLPVIPGTSMTVSISHIGRATAHFT